MSKMNSLQLHMMNYARSIENRNTEPHIMEFFVFFFFWEFQEKMTLQLVIIQN